MDEPDVPDDVGLWLERFLDEPQKSGISCPSMFE
jgi:hypothetical protein